MHRLCVLLLGCVAFMASACEEVDDNVRCASDNDCEDGQICYSSYCKGSGGIACIRHSQCASGACTKGVCEKLR